MAVLQVSGLLGDLEWEGVADFGEAARKRGHRYRLLAGGLIWLSLAMFALGCMVASGGLTDNLPNTSSPNSQVSNSRG